MINRVIQLPPKQSIFLFGPRQTGKSTLIESRYPIAIWKINLLLTDTFLKYAKFPSLFRKEALEKIKNEKIKTIFIDEIQRVPDLLNEVQVLMGSTDCQFILTGSSARKLKRGAANLLAGRAIEYHLFPFVYEELPNVPLHDLLTWGSLPALIGKTEQEKKSILSTYANVYLQEEIQNEGIVRNLGGFSRFLDLAASQFGELVSFSAIARECHLPTRTVQSYYEILEDTLIGFRLKPWHQSFRKRLVNHPKFYFFDLGVLNALNKRLTGTLDPLSYGRMFEHWIILETYRWLHYKGSEASLYFWRTHHGAEVDLVIEKHGKIVGAFEIKSSSTIAGTHLSGLRSFREQNTKVPCYVVSSVPNAYELDQIKILPWASYLQLLHKIL